MVQALILQLLRTKAGSTQVKIEEDPMLRPGKKSVQRAEKGGFCDGRSETFGRLDDWAFRSLGV